MIRRTLLAVSIAWISFYQRSRSNPDFLNLIKGLNSNMTRLDSLGKVNLLVDRHNAPNCNYSFVNQCNAVAYTVTSAHFKISDTM